MEELIERAFEVRDALRHCVACVDYGEAGGTHWTGKRNKGQDIPAEKKEKMGEGTEEIVMAELIDRSALLADIDGTFVASGKSASAYAEIRGAKKIIARIKAAPTVDAVPVVRCRDCKHYDGKWLCKISGVPSRKPCDFCSHGERKDGDVDG